MNIFRKQFFSALLCMGILAATESHATVYNATRDFSTSSNPDGVWSYGYSASGGSSYSMTLFDNQLHSWWVKAGYVILDVPAAGINTSGSRLNGVDPDQLFLHPGPVSYGDFAILRFTAPATGTYDVTGQFFAGDSGSMSGSIVLEGNILAPLQYFASTTDLSIFTPLAVSLSSGETLDFVVGNNGNFLFGSTPLSVTITSTSGAVVAEPATMPLLAMALMGGLGFARRRSFPAS